MMQISVDVKAVSTDTVQHLMRCSLPAREARATDGGSISQAFFSSGRRKSDPRQCSSSSSKKQQPFCEQPADFCQNEIDGGELNHEQKISEVE